jgi:hypothetical protein
LSISPPRKSQSRTTTFVTALLSSTMSRRSSYLSELKPGLFGLVSGSPR